MPHSPEDLDRVRKACERGGSSMFGSGISPGYINQLSVVAAGICDRVDKITINEAADTTFYDSPETEKPVGFGQPIDSPDLQAMTSHGTGVFGEASGRITSNCRQPGSSRTEYRASSSAAARNSSMRPDLTSNSAMTT